MSFMAHRKHTRTVLLSLFLMALVAGVVWAATEVTVTKTSQKYASAVQFDGTTYKGAYIQELTDGYYLSYYIYELDGGYTIVEQGAGYIDSGDVSWTSAGLSLDTNTEDIATVGDGGDIVLDWSFAPDSYYEQASKTTTEQAGTKTINFGTRETATATVEGTYFDEDFTGTGYLQEMTGKTIVQIK